MSDQTTVQTPETEEVTPNDSNQNEGPSSREIRDAATRGISVSRVSRKREVAEDDFNFTDDLDALDIAFEKEEHVVTFEDPKSGKKFDFLVRELTAAEHAMVFGNLFPKNMEQMVKDLGKDATNEKVEEYIKNQVAQMDSEALIEEQRERKYRVVQLGIIKPEGITIERLRKWDNFVIDNLYLVIMGGMSDNTVASNFSEVDESPE